MTIGILTYTNDQRYQALHTEGSDEWSLRITSPQTRDSGVYECQVSTEPKISQAYRLNVVGEFDLMFCSKRISLLARVTRKTNNYPYTFMTVFHKEKRLKIYVPKIGTNKFAKTTKSLGKYLFNR